MHKISNKTKSKLFLYAVFTLSVGLFSTGFETKNVMAEIKQGDSVTNASSVENVNETDAQGSSIVLSTGKSDTTSAQQIEDSRVKTDAIVTAPSADSTANDSNIVPSAGSTIQSVAIKPSEESQVQSTATSNVGSSTSASETSSQSATSVDNSSVEFQNQGNQPNSDTQHAQSVSSRADSAAITEQQATSNIKRPQNLSFLKDVSGNVTPNPNQNDLSANTYYFIGDSITAGQYFPSGAIVSNTYPDEFAKTLKADLQTLRNEAVPGTKIDVGIVNPGDPDYVINSLSNIAVADPKKMADESFDVLVIGFGTNDFIYGNVDLRTLEQSLHDSLKKILTTWTSFKRTNPAKIYAVLPLPTFYPQTKTNSVLNDPMDFVGQMGYTQNDLRQALISVYDSFGIKYYTWDTNLVTAENRWNTLSDGVTHPNQVTYEQMGKDLANFVQNNLPSTENIVNLDKDYSVPDFDTGYGTNLVEDKNQISSENQRLVGLSTDTSSGRKILFDQFGRPLVNQYDDANQYYYGNDGFSISGFKSIDGSLYFFSPGTYKKATSQMVNANGSGYLLDATGRALSGLQKFNGTWYYFDPQTHLRADNQYIQTSWGSYYFGNNGVISSGLTAAYGTWYYFDPQSFLRVDNQYIQMPWGGYYFDNGGTIASGLTAAYGTWYYFDPQSHLRVNNQYIQMPWGGYYFDNGGSIASGLTAAYGTWYYFDPQSHLRVDNQYIQMSWGAYYFGSGGVIASGVTAAYGTWYYFDPQTHLRVDNQYIQMPWGGYYFNGGGTIASGLTYAFGTWYYFNPQNHLRTDSQFVKLGSDIRYFDDGGAMVKGFKFINGHWYYFDQNNGVLKQGSFVVNGKLYETNNDGEIVNY